MTSGVTAWIPSRRRAIAILLGAIAVVVTVANCVLAIANAANAAPARHQDGFGAAVRVAAGHATARLAPPQHGRGAG